MNAGDILRQLPKPKNGKPFNMIATALPDQTNRNQFHPVITVEYEGNYITLTNETVSLHYAGALAFANDVIDQIKNRWSKG